MHWISSYFSIIIVVVVVVVAAAARDLKLFCQCKDKQISLSSDVTTSSFSQPIENEVDIFESMDNAANTTTINRETEREREEFI